MKSALTALTPRGRLLLCVGLAAALAGILIGERDLLRVGTFVALLPLAAVVAVLRVPSRIRHARALEPQCVPMGQDARVRLRLANPLSRIATGALFVSDTVPHGLGGQPRFNLGTLRPRETRELTYRIRAHMRGRFPVGPLTVRFRDPLGCAELARPIGSSMSLVVTPAVVALPPVPARGDSADGGHTRSRTVSSAGEDDTVPREYRRGDELRRIHWRSTARQGKPMVRREEQPWQEHCTILLDVRASAHAGSGAESSLETAVAVAGSIAGRVLADGLLLRFITSDTELKPGNRTDTMLESLAVLRASRATSLSGGADLIGHARTASGGLTVAVLGALRPREVEALGQACGGYGQHLAVVNPQAAWPTLEAAESAKAALTRAGWLVLSLTATADLPALWEGIASTPQPNVSAGGARYGTSTHLAGQEGRQT